MTDLKLLFFGLANAAMAVWMTFYPPRLPLLGIANLAVAVLDLSLLVGAL